MTIKDTIKSISLEAFLLEGMIAFYCNQLSQDDPVRGAALLSMIENDEQMHQQALHAAADGVIFSQLALSLLDDNEFRDALECRRSFDDDAIASMRLALFNEGLSVACETAGDDADALARAERRKVAATEVLGSKD